MRIKTLPYILQVQTVTTVLLHCIFKITVDILKVLLKYMKSLSPQNSAGNTPLHWACLNSHFDTVKLLVENGADMYVKNNAGKDALWEAEQRGNEEMVRWMLGIGEEKEVGELVEGEEVEVEDEKLEHTTGNLSETKDKFSVTKGAE